MTLSVDLSPLVLGGMLLVRITTFLMALPGFGMRAVPMPARIAFAVWLSVAVVPLAMDASPDVALTPGWLTAALAGEFLLGLLLAFTVIVIFASVQLAGQIVGMQVGFAIVNTIDPQTQAQVSIIAQLYYLMAVLIFVSMDGPLMMIRALAETVRVIPPGSLRADSSHAIYELCLNVSHMFSIGLRMAAPPVITLLLTSTAMGFIARTVPQLNILIVGFPLQILVGLVMLAASIPLLGSLISAEMFELPFDLIGLARALGGGR